MIRDYIDEILVAQENYNRLKTVVGDDAKVSEVIDMAVSMAQMGLGREDVERIAKFMVSSEALRLSMRLRQVAEDIEGIVP